MQSIVSNLGKQSKVLAGLCYIIFYEHIASFLKAEALSIIITALNFAPTADILLCMKSPFGESEDGVYQRLLHMLVDSTTNQHTLVIKLSKEILMRLWIYNRLEAFKQIVQIDGSEAHIKDAILVRYRHDTIDIQGNLCVYATYPDICRRWCPKHSIRSTMLFSAIFTSCELRGAAN
jgi:hypothetical protein